MEKSEQYKNCSCAPHRGPVSLNEACGGCCACLEMQSLHLIDRMQAKIDELEKEKKELAGALEFYASEKSWKDLVEEEGCLNCSMSKGVLDCIDYEDCEDELGGKRARQALAKIKRKVRDD